MSTTTPALEVLSIPELLDIMQRSLSPHDLAQCVLVSTEFSALFTPLLWHTVSIKTLPQHIHFTTSPDVQRALFRNSRFVRVIRVWTCKSLRPFMAIKPEDMCSLSALEFSWPTNAARQATSLTEGVARSALRDTSNERVAWSVDGREVKRQLMFSLHLGCRLDALGYLHKLRTETEDGPTQSAQERYKHQARLLRLQRNELTTPVIPIWQRPFVPPPDHPSSEVYEDLKDEQLLILFLSIFPELKIFMSTSLSYFSPGVLKVLGSRLGQLRYLSMTLDDIGIKNRYWDLKDFLDKSPPSLEKLRLMFSNTRWVERVQTHNQVEPGVIESTMSMPNSDKARPPLLSMRSLQIEDNVTFPHGTRIYPQPWLSVLKRCTHLTILSLASVQPSVLSDVASIISDNCPMIDNLALGCFNLNQPMTISPTSPNLASIFAACSARTEEEVKYPAAISLSPVLKLASTERKTGLKKLRLYGIPFEDEDLNDMSPYSQSTITPLRALNRHVGCLTHLDFDSILKSDIGELFIRIMETFPYLEYLNALPFARRWSTRLRGKVDAKLLVDSASARPWACTETLRELKVNINGFRSHLNEDYSARLRPSLVTVVPEAPNNADDLEPVSDGLSTSLSGQMRLRGRDRVTIQHRVCQHLNTLTSLQELCLGIHPLDGMDYGKDPLHGVQDDCLELSIESGLDLMEDLKELREISVMRMKHRIRLPELQWMCANWTKLEAVYGLLSADSYEDADEKQTLKDEEQHIIHWIQENRPLLKYHEIRPLKGSLGERRRNS
ncbi:hypothetical protein BGX33_003248 [Mortierella sp. NVP41]|nr:hypothetical protein BGX33_003248 [Mortierella sp. NVP41]